MSEMCCTRLAENICCAISLQVRHLSTKTC